MNEQQRTWLIIGAFVLVFGLLSAVIQSGAPRGPLSATGREPRPAPEGPAPAERGKKVDPLRGVVGSDEGTRYFQ